MQGRTLGNYKLEELLGKGGMGEVYLATDTRLERKVAIKILPPEVAQDDARRQRLEREARAISGLNHPHICTLHDVGHEDGTDFLVMELLEGETLAERIGRGPMKGEEFLETALQITDALNTAHRAGLVHRDLKPGNVMLTKGGAKLLDFGLARVAQQDGVSGLTAAPTMTSPLTAAGTLVGTFQYLAPELLEGGQADARSDLFALGIVLYEMVTGRRAFEAKTQAGLIGAILERDPVPIGSIVSDVSPALENLIRACLAKDPEQRIQTAHDVLLQLRWIRDGGSAVGIPTVQARSRKRMTRLAWGLAALFAVSTAALGIVALTRETPRPLRVVASIEAPGDLVFIRHPNLSPDGTTVAFIGIDAEDNVHLYLRTLGRDETRKLEDTGNAYFAFWSPDGRSLGFFQRGQRIFRIDVLGGNRQTIADVADPAGASWGPHDTVVVGSWDPAVGLVRVPAGGGAPVPIEFRENHAEGTAYMWPQFLPDGEHLLVTAWTESFTHGELRVVSLDGRINRTLFPVQTQVQYVQGHLLYVQEGNLLARPFDPGGFEPGEPFPVHSPVRVGANSGLGAFSGSENGLLVLLEGEREARGDSLVVYDRTGAVARTVELPTRASDLDLSPDDARVAVSRPVTADGGGLWDIWSYDLARDVFTRISFTGACDDPVWSADGRGIAYARGGTLVRKPASGVGEAEVLVDLHDDAVTHDWSLDGSTVIYCVTDEPHEDLWAYDLEGDRGAYAVLSSPFREYQGQLSPDGKWLAYTSDESGERQIYLLRWPALDEKLQISRDGGVMPRWKRDGSELFYLSMRRELMSVRLRETASTPDIGQPERLFRTGMSTGNRTHEYDVDSAGEHFYMIEATAQEGEITPIRLIANWLSGR